MRKLRLLILSAIVVSTISASALIIGLLRPAASTPAPAVTFVYAAKWICNIPLSTQPNQTLLNPTAAEDIGLVPGEYKTDINVHNPSHSLNLTILKKFVVSVPEPKPGAIFTNRIAFSSAFVFPDGAFFIDCNDIFSVFRASGVNICPTPTQSTCPVKGFVILSANTAGGGFASANSLDVVAEYSSESFGPTSTYFGLLCMVGSTFTPCSSTGISLDVEKIPGTPFVP